ncbi:MAG TPA: hypothetical protein VGK01_20635 [Candidatus Angelobacter sp.]|jgi:hypothetical protein
MKTAVYQVTEGDGRARLICVAMPTLHDATIFEAWLRMHADLMTGIRFLGRFDAVQTALSQQEAEELILGSGQDLLLPGNGNSSTIPPCPGRATRENNP